MEGPTPFMRHPTPRFRVITPVRIWVPKVNYQRAGALLDSSGITIFRSSDSDYTILVYQEESEIRKVLHPIPFILL